ncbi:MAG: hypothetical protein JSV16_12360 [Candidatus Hydrogenedentota bacterium]|nr:MAG: hypothetical protein JSV16_12360 [Candidatus Hydrogenedentota bacterium]
MARKIAPSKSSRGDYSRVGYRGTGKIFLIAFSFFLAGKSIAQPRATLKPHPQAVPLNRDLRLVLELVWAGEADLYDIPQPDLSVLSQFQVVERKLSAERRGDENRLRHQLVMRPLKEGEYDFGQIRVEYFEKGKDIPTLIPLDRTFVRVVPPELVGQRTKVAIGAGAVIAAAVAAILLALRFRGSARSRKLSESETTRHTRDNLLAELNAARSSLIEGEIGTYLVKLCELADSDMLRPHGEGTHELRDLMENVKFGGRTASPDQLNWAEKMVRNAILKALPPEDEEEGE